MSIENPKIASIRPNAAWWDQWAPKRFPGLSLLLDNPARSLTEREGFATIHCDANDPNHNLELYRTLAHALESHEAELRKCRLVPIDPSTFHVTLWDGINQANIHSLKDQRLEYDTLLAGLPASMAGVLPTVIPPRTIRLPVAWAITFRFKGLKIWMGANALVALLEPTDSESVKAIDLLKERRRELDDLFAPLGKPPNADWTPHITLGYFASSADAERALPFLASWTDNYWTLIGQHHITYTSASLYAFGDMHTFWQWRFPAVVVSLPVALAAKEASISGIGSKGDQKIALPYHFPGTEFLGQTRWTPLAPNGRRQYHILPRVELALFDQRAKQDCHRHDKATEIYTVLEGTMAIRVGAQECLLLAGDTIVIQPGVDHHVQKAGRFLTRVVVANAGGQDDKHIACPAQATGHAVPPQVLVVPMHSLETAEGRLGSSGAQKIFVVGEPRADEGVPTSVFWTQLSTLGTHPVVSTSNLGMAVFDQRAKQDRHFHKLATEIYSVLRGTMRIEIAGTDYDLAAGDTVMVTPWAIHQVKPGNAFLTQVLTLNSTGASDKYIGDA